MARELVDGGSVERYAEPWSIPWSMANDDGRERCRFHLLRPSKCTPAQLEERAREVFRAWLELRAER